MKKKLSHIMWGMLFFIALPCTALDPLPSHDLLTSQDINTCIEQDEFLIFLDHELIGLIDHFNKINHQSTQSLICFTMLCSLINTQKNGAPYLLVKTALEEIFEYLINTDDPLIEEEKKEQFLKVLDEYYNKLESLTCDTETTISNDDHQEKFITKNSRFKRYRTLQTNTLLTNYLTSKNTTLNGTVLVGTNQSITDGLIASGTLHVASESDFFESIEIVGKPQQGCIHFVDDAMNEKGRICSSSLASDKGIFVSVDGGATQNIRITNEGGITIAAPTSNAALSVTGNSDSSAITAVGNGTTSAPALRLLNVPAGTISDTFLTIDDSGVVKQIFSETNAIIKDCQDGPLVIGTNNPNSITFATNGCTSRLVIDSNGTVTIVEPVSGEALTIDGTLVVPQTNSADTQGSLKLGGTASTRINVYTFGSRNFFAGSGTSNTTISGTDNVSIGTNANSTLTNLNNTIGIGTNTQVTAADSTALGNAANTSGSKNIIIGSTDSTSSGAAPTATTTSSIVLGSAQGSNAGASASGSSAIAIGGANTIFAGATASGSQAIALGVNPAASGNSAIALGSASNTAGGSAALASNTAAIALGSAQDGFKGANATNIASIAMGSANGNAAGAAALGSRSIAIGVNANTTSSAAGATAIGSASSIGSAAPTASNVTAIALGSAQGSQRGALASSATAIAIGASDGTSLGASATTSARSIAIGTGASAATADLIVLGNAAATAVQVGIGTSTPAAKLDIVGSDGTPIIRLNQVNSGLTNAPRWLNPSTSASSGTPLHYNGSNQLFGFTSSKRYKTNIRSLESQSEIIYQLNPVIYDSKNDVGKNIPGFIAEEVATIAPHLVVLNDQGTPENIAYNALHALVIKELQKHQQSITYNASKLKEQKNRLHNLQTITQELHAKSAHYKNNREHHCSNT